MNALPIDTPRLLADLEALAAYTEPGTTGWTRRAFSPAFVAGRAWLADQMRAVGLTVAVDAAGNLVGRRAGSADLPPLVVGSHSDSVLGGGRYDGPLGVLAGLALARALDQAGLQLRHPLEIIDFLAEEPTPYGACLGSMALVSGLDGAALARRAPDGTTLAEALALVGGNPARLAETIRAPGSIAAYLELHIEQGRVLEAAGAPIGAVRGIVGIRRALLWLEGRPDHAGTTPMALRQDALAAAAALVLATESAARAHSEAVATVGALLVSPNQANVVPGRVELRVEVRSLDWSIVERVWDELLDAGRAACAERDVTLVVQELDDTPPMLSPDWLVTTLANACDAVAPGVPRLTSGAGHDGSWLGRIAPAGMIFVRSRDGRSHCPEEYSAPDDVAAGVAALAWALLAVDQREA